VSYNKPDGILRWKASPTRADQVQHTSEEGRIRFVTFILGRVARDNFLRAMKRQIRLQANARATSLRW
jgi:hypothetical protein